MIPWPAIWQWLDQVHLLPISITIVSIWLIVKVLLKLWPGLRKFVTLMTALLQLPVFMEETTKTLKAQDEGALQRDIKIEEIHHEVHYNNGSSVKDAIKRQEETSERIELGVKALYDRVTASEATAVELREDLESTKPTVRKRKPPTKRDTP